MLFAAEFNKVHRTLCPAPVGLPEMFKPWYQSPGADPVGCCAALLEAGASPNLIPGDLYDAPIFSAIHASPAVLELLIGAGADVNVTEQHGETALAHACRFGFSQQVAALLAAGADVNASKDDGVSPAFLACQRGHTECLELLIDAGADVHRAAKDGATPMSIARQRGHTKCLELIGRAVRSMGGRVHLVKSAARQPRIRH